ncbi:MAG: carbonic anhydrase [Thermoguttaceae bacterium]
MGSGELESIYHCKLPFEASRTQAAAIYCSDGRFGEHMDDFLHNALKLPRYDRLTIPGGVACLGGHFRSFREEDALLAHLRFLIAVHRLRRVVLIAHEECAFYTEGLHLPAARALQQQLEDVGQAMTRIQSLSREVEVDAYLASRHEEGVHFRTLRG